MQYTLKLSGLFVLKDKRFLYSKLGASSVQGMKHCKDMTHHGQ